METKAIWKKSILIYIFPIILTRANVRMRSNLHGLEQFRLFVHRFHSEENIFRRQNLEWILDVNNWYSGFRPNWEFEIIQQSDESDPRLHHTEA